MTLIQGVQQISYSGATGFSLYLAATGVYC